MLKIIEGICKQHGIKFTVLKLPETEEYREFLKSKRHEAFYVMEGRTMTMFEFMAFYHKKDNGEYGYGWCGKQRWGTTLKKQILNRYYQSLDRFVVEYVGIAADETERMDIKPKKNYTKSYPLVKWKMTEKDCLDFCYSMGITWTQNGIRLYDILDRVSCQHCQNKNKKEIQNIREYLPELWEDFMLWQSYICYPYRSDGRTIFDLDDQLEATAQQVRLDTSNRCNVQEGYHQMDLFCDCNI